MDPARQKLIERARELNTSTFPVEETQDRIHDCNSDERASPDNSIVLRGVIHGRDADAFRGEFYPIVAVGSITGRHEDRYLSYLHQRTYTSSTSSHLTWTLVPAYSSEIGHNVNVRPASPHGEPSP